VKRARHLRREMTVTEQMLWKALRALKLNVRRQAPIGRYIADFVHHGAALVIEADSARHDLEDAVLHDATRDAWLKSQGYAVLRVRDTAVYNDLPAVVERVRAELAARGFTSSAETDD